MRVEIHDEADQELVEGSLYIERERAGYGERLIAAFEDARDLIAAYPKIGRKEGRVRVRPVHGFSYNIIYAVRKDSILIVAVAHQSRRPGYWLHRLRR
jgi:plasmid stabilization system protein ParE